MINKTTMIERAKQKRDLQLSTSFFWKVSSNKLDQARGVEECEDIHREPHLTSSHESGRENRHGSLLPEVSGGTTVRPCPTPSCDLLKSHKSHPQMLEYPHFGKHLPANPEGALYYFLVGNHSLRLGGAECLSFFDLHS